VLLRHKTLDRYPLKFLLLRFWFLQHDSKIQKAPVENESLSWVIIYLTKYRNCSFSFGVHILGRTMKLIGPEREVHREMSYVRLYTSAAVTTAFSR
jgi:hypothetical protein